MNDEVIEVTIWTVDRGNYQNFAVPVMSVDVMFVNIMPLGTVINFYLKRGKGKQIILFLHVAIAGLQTTMEMAANLPNDTNTTHEFVMSAELSQYLKNTSLIIYFVAFVLGVLGNGVVIWVIGFEMKKTVYTLWLLNLAVADFFYAAFLPLNLMYLVFDICDLFVFVSCKLSRALRFLNMFASGKCCCFLIE